jgi:hypothetical protein
MSCSLIPLLDPNARAGRTGHRLKVKDARDLRMRARHLLGNSREDTPTTREIIQAARHLSALLHDATEGDASLLIQVKAGDDVETHHPATVISYMAR